MRNVPKLMLDSLATPWYYCEYIVIKVECPMKFGAHNQKLLLVLGLLLAVSLLGASVHHHEGDEHCWYCTTAAAALLPLVALALALPYTGGHIGLGLHAPPNGFYARPIQSRAPPTGY